MLSGYAAEGIFIPLYLAACGLAVLNPCALKKFFGRHVGLRVCVTVLLCAAGVLIMLIVSLMAGAASRGAGDRTTVIVLGCQVVGDEPSPMLRRRCEAAYEYLSGHENAVVIASGGRGEDGGLSEAEVIKRTLVSLGVPQDRIFLEERSTDTRENLLYSAQIIKSLGLSREVVTVSDAFHQYRASVFAKRAGLSAEPFSCGAPFLSELCFWCREIVAVLHMWITGS